MSLRAMLWALHEAPCASPTQRVILLAMADTAHDDGTCSFRSQGAIAAIARTSTRCVREHLADMESHGLIRRGDQKLVEHYRKDRRPIVWDLSMVRPEDSSARNLRSARKPDVATAGTSASNDRNRGSYKTSTNPELNRGISPGNVPPTLAALRAAESDCCEHGAIVGRCGKCRVAS